MTEHSLIAHHVISTGFQTWKLVLNFVLSCGMASVKSHTRSRMLIIQIIEVKSKTDSPSRHRRFLSQPPGSCVTPRIPLATIVPIRSHFLLMAGTHVSSRWSAGRTSIGSVWATLHSTATSLGPKSRSPGIKILSIPLLPQDTSRTFMPHGGSKSRILRQQRGHARNRSHICREYSWLGRNCEESNTHSWGCILWIALALGDAFAGFLV